MEKNVLCLPEKWNEWDVVEKLGEGSFGCVYKIQKMEEGKVVYNAVKVIRIGEGVSQKAFLFRNEEFFNSYMNGMLQEKMHEIQAMEALRENEHIVQIQDYHVENLGAEGFLLYIRMEYVQCLSEYVKFHKMNEDKVRELGIELCEALKACHKAGLIHRDIKMENVFVTADGHFKLGDLGEAVWMNQLYEVANTVCGSLAYMAPEIYRGEYYDHRADLYSLGILMYKLLNNNCDPFCENNNHTMTIAERNHSLRERMKGTKFPVLMGISSSMNKIILKSCAFQQKKRYAGAEELQVALENANKVFAPFQKLVFYVCN